MKCITAACSPGPAASVFDVAETIQFLPQFWACLERPSRFVSHNLAIFRLGVRWTVEGFAKRSGKGVQGAMVVLVPKDPESNHELFRRDQSDLDGSFSLQSAIPGSYTIIALENAWDLDWAKPAVLARYCQHGRIIIVGDQTSEL